MSKSNPNNSTERNAIYEARDCISCMHEGMLVTDEQGLVVEANVAAERILETPVVESERDGDTQSLPCATEL